MFEGFAMDPSKRKKVAGKVYSKLEQNQFMENDMQEAFQLESLQDKSQELMIKRLVLCQKKVPQLLISFIDFIYTNNYVNEQIVNRCLKVICLIGSHLDQIHVELFS
jgi:hypothetical protein